VTLTLHLRRRGRPALAAVLAGAAAVAVTSCSTQSPPQTQLPYIPADGVPANIGPVQARDLLVVAPSKGAAGVLSGSVVNTSSAPVTVTFLTVAESQSGTASGPSIQLGASQQQRITGVQFASVQDPPGGLTGIVLKTAAGLVNVNVPVLLPNGPYATITSTQAPTTATSTTTQAPTPAATAGTTTATTGATGTQSPTPPSPSSPTSVIG
jgi:hypothetical protein